jgi:hypothetical protein
MICAGLALLPPSGQLCSRNKARLFNLEPNPISHRKVPSSQLVIPFFIIILIRNIVHQQLKVCRFAEFYALKENNINIKYSSVH